MAFSHRRLLPLLCEFFRAQGYTAVHDCPVIFVRIGNLRRGPLLAKFESVMQDLIQALNNGDKIIEIA